MLSEFACRSCLGSKSAKAETVALVLKKKARRESTSGFYDVHHNYILRNCAVHNHVQILHRASKVLYTSWNHLIDLARLSIRAECLRRSLLSFFRFIRGRFGPRCQSVDGQSVDGSATARAGQAIRVSRRILPTEAVLLLFERRHGTVEGRVLPLQGQKRHPGNPGPKWEGQNAEEVPDGGSVQ